MVLRLRVERVVAVDNFGEKGTGTRFQARQDANAAQAFALDLDDATAALPTRIGDRLRFDDAANENAVFEKVVVPRDDRNGTGAFEAQTAVEFVFRQLEKVGVA